ncbi:MAG: ribonuclease activity regulator RraA [Alphaproteobacteria bacterium]
MSRPEHKAWGPLEEEVRDLLNQCTAATVSGILWRSGIRNNIIRDISPIDDRRASFIGTAYTLRYLPARDDVVNPSMAYRSDRALHVAADEIAEGDVLVVDARGVTDAGVIGDVLGGRIVKRGGVAIVTDGGMRDVAELREMGLPVWCRSRAAPGPSASHYPYEVQSAVACGETLVIPGDVLIGNDDGVIVIPRQMAAEIARHARDHDAMEAFIRRRIDAGAPAHGNYPPSEETLDAFEKEMGYRPRW